ncbi:MAG TPA: E2/UBC family protein [Actinomycetota bacterium]
MTADDFEAYMRSRGYTVEVITGQDGNPYSVVRNVELPKGALRGQRCDIAIGRNGSVPFVPPAAIHTRPHLVPMDSNEPLRTIASGIGPEWQYWSRRFDRTPTPAGLWAHILTVLCDDRWPTS